MPGWGYAHFSVGWDNCHTSTPPHPTHLFGEGCCAWSRWAHPLGERRGMCTVRLVGPVEVTALVPGPASPGLGKGAQQYLSHTTTGLEDPASGLPVRGSPALEDVAYPKSHTAKAVGGRGEGSCKPIHKSWEGLSWAWGRNEAPQTILTRRPSVSATFARTAVTGSFSSTARAAMRSSRSSCWLCARSA